MLHVNKNLLQFDAFELNWNTRQLFREGDPVAVEPKALELIHYLLLHRDRAVGKDELAEALWPNRVISDTVISQTVRKARAAVDDDGDRQAVIATVRGFGYRFVADVSKQEQAPELASSRSAVLSWRSGGVVLAAIILLVVTVVLHDSRTAQAPELRTVAVVPGVTATASDTPEWLANAVTDVIHSVLTDSPSWVVVPGPVVSAQLELADHPQSGITGLFEQLGVSHVISGELTDDNGNWELALRQVDASGTEEIVRARGDRPLRLALQAARNVADPSGLRNEEDIAPWLQDEWLAESYFRGIGAMRQGDADTAAGLFASILEFNPDHPWVRYQLATALNARGQYVEAADILESLVYDSLLKTENAKLHRLAANALGVTWWYRGDLDTASDYFRMLVNGGREANHLLNAANGELNLGMAYSTRGDFEQAEAHYIEAMALYSRAGYQPGRAHVANALGIQAFRQNQPDQAKIWHGEALEIRRGLGNQRDISESLYNLGLIAAMHLNWDESERLIEEAIMLARAVNDPGRELNYAANLGWNRARTGRIREGRNLLFDTLERARKLGYRHVEADCVKFLGALEAMSGNHETALEWYEQALARYGPEDYGADRIVAELSRAQALLNLDRSDDAVESLDRLTDAGALSHQPGNRSHYLRMRARLAGIHGDETVQQKLLEEAVEISMVSGDRNRVIEARSALARYHLDRYQTDPAREALNALSEQALARPQMLILRAELAWQEANASLAIELLEEARNLFGERWRQKHQSRLEQFRSEA